MGVVKENWCTDVEGESLLDAADFPIREHSRQEGLCVVLRGIDAGLHRKNRFAVHGALEIGVPDHGHGWKSTGREARLPLGPRHVVATLLDQVDVHLALGTVVVRNEALKGCFIGSGHRFPEVDVHGARSFRERRRWARR